MAHLHAGHLSWPAAAALALLAGSGCSIHISRTRDNVPLDQEGYRKLEVDRTTEGEALAALGAPDQIEAKSDQDYLWYLHRDSTRIGLRFESPISYFGYRHTIAELDVNAEDTSAMRLVFERNGVLRQKSLRLAPAYAEPDTPSPGLAFYLLPRYGYSLLQFGDGGEKSYGKLFGDGQLFGGYLGIMPTPYFMMLIGGNYQTFEGDSFHALGSRVSLEDLQLYQLELGGRFQLPPRFFVSFWDVEKLKALFYTDDTRRHLGPFAYFQWTVGGTFNEDVGARVGGTPSGTYFDRSFGLSTALEAGVEYRWSHLGFNVGINYQVLSAFNEGSLPLDTTGGDFTAFTFTGGLSWRF